MKAVDIAEAALAAATGDGAEAVVLQEHSGLARFAGSEVHQPTLVDNLAVTLRIVRDGRVGNAMTNRVDPDGLKLLAERAVAAAASARVEPDFPGLSTPQRLPEVMGWDEALAELGPEDQARFAAQAIGAGGGADLYGFFTSAQTELAVVSTTGVSAEQRMTDATTLVLAAWDGASGYAEQSGWSASGIDPQAVTREALTKAARTTGAHRLEPGRYRAVLEPYAVADLIQYFGYDSFGALGLLEERSYLAGRIGEQVFDQCISIADDALDPHGLPKAFDFEGSPKQRVELIRNGVASDVVWDRPTAALARDGHATTGHAPPAILRAYGPLPFALSLAPGEAGSVDELADLVGDGIYVTRLHYLSVVQAREGVITGMTRDGTFRIRNGRIAEPLVNLRFTVSVPELLSDVPGLGKDVALVNGSDFYGERYPFGVLTPALATATFTVTGSGSAPGV